MAMIQYIFHTLTILLVLITFSCSSLNQDKPKIRLVDINGKSRKIITRIPDMNLKALAQQGQLYSATQNMMEINSSHKDDKFTKFNILKKFTIKKPKKNNTKITKKHESSKIIKKENKVPLQQDSSKLASSKNSKNDFANFSSSTIESSLANNSQPKITEIEYDLSNNSKASKKEIAIKDNDKPQEIKAQNYNYQSNKKIYVQVGSFSKEINAIKFLKYMNKFNKGEIQPVKTISGEIYRVVLGPYNNIDSANKTVKIVKSSGHDALILVNK